MSTVAIKEYNIRSPSHILRAGNWKTITHIIIILHFMDHQFKTSVKSPPRPDNLLGLRFVPPSTLELTFEDKAFSLEIDRLEMPVDRMCWETSARSFSGTAMTVKAIKGEEISIDSSVLRCLVDEQYAAEVRASLNALQLTEDEFTHIITNQGPRPPWLDEPDEDLRLDSWK